MRPIVSAFAIALLSAGSDSPLYGEGGNITLQEAMRRGAKQAGDAR